MSEAPH